MSGGLKVGDLFAVFTVSTNTAGFFKGVENVAKGAEKLGNQLKAVGAEAAQLGARLAAGMTLAVHEAAKHNLVLEKEVKRVTQGYDALATSVGTMLLPVVKDLADNIARVANWFNSLSPATKQQIAHFLQMTAAVVGVIAVVGRIGGLMAAFGKAVQVVLPLVSTVFSGIVAAIGGLASAMATAGAAIWGALTAPITGTMLLIAGAIAAVAGLGYLIYKTWSENLGGIQDKVRSAVDFIGKMFSALWENIKSRFLITWNFIADNLVRPFAKALGWFRDYFFGNISRLLELMQAGLKKVGIEMPESFQFLQDINEWLRQLGTGEGFSNLIKDTAATGVAMGQAIAAGVKQGLTKAEDFTKLVLAKIKGLLPDLSSQSTTAPDPDKRRFGVAMNFERGPKGGTVGNLGTKGASAIASGEGLARAHEAYEIIDRRLPAEAQRLVAAVAQGVSGFVSAIGDKLANSGGALGDTIKGFQNGGLAGAFTALLENSRQFQEVTTMLDGIFQRVADSLGQLVGAVEPLIGAIADVIFGGLAALQPLFDALQPIFDSLLAPLEGLGVAIQALAPVFRLVGVAMQYSLQPVLEAFGLALRGVAIVVLGVIDGVVHAFNAINGWVADLMKALHFADADDLRKFQVDTKDMDDALQMLVDGTDDQLRAQARTTADMLRLGDAASKATEQLTNVPSGYKVALARFNAIMTGDSGGGSSGSGGGSSGGGGGPTLGGGVGDPDGGGGGGRGVGDVYLDGDRVGSILRGKNDRENVRGTGSTVPIASRWAGSGGF